MILRSGVSYYFGLSVCTEGLLVMVVGGCGLAGFSPFFKLGCLGVFAGVLLRMCVGASFPIWCAMGCRFSV